MYYPVEIIIKNYKPLLVEQGMLFSLLRNEDSDDEYIEIWAVDKVPNMPAIKFFEKHGYPIQLHLMTEEGIILDDEESPEEIEWWWDDGDDTDELRVITLEDINTVFREFDGVVEIDVNINDILDRNIVTPLLTENKFTLKLPEWEDDVDFSLN